MRCKHCDKRLAPSEYHWDAVLKDHVENCGGSCVLRGSFAVFQPDPIVVEDEDDLIPDEVGEDTDGVVQQWVPERE